MNIKTIIEENNTRAGRIFNWVIISLIIYSSISIALETLPDLHPMLHRFFVWSERIVTIAFTIEYLLRIFVAEKKWQYPLSFFGIVDFMAILPFYLALGIDLRALRLVRITRIFRLAKLARYNKAIVRFAKALNEIREELVIFTVLSVIFIYFTSIGIYYFEHPAQPEAFSSIVHSLWWAVATLTTVGYGDVYPITTGGKLFTFLVLMLGLGIVAIPASLLSSALTQIKSEEKE